MRISRRRFLAAGSAVLAAWQCSASGQSPPAPSVGFLNSGSEPEYRHLAAAFRNGLAAGGYIEGKNVSVDYRWAEGHYERLPSLARELVQRRVNVIVAQGPPAAKAAQAATARIPVVFAIGDDPVRMGLVSSIAHPGGNVTGISFLASQILTKRIELARDIVGRASDVAVLVNPGSSLAEVDRREAAAAAKALGLQVHVLDASTDADLERAFASMAGRRVAACVIGADPFFNARRNKVIALARQKRIPTIYSFREFPANGGLASYGTNLASAYRSSGVYVARILGGAKPADLPVLLPAEFELVVNARTAKELGISIPPALRASVSEIVQ